MNAKDMRSLPAEARHERRVQVIRLRKEGLTYEAIAAEAGLSRTGVFNICARYAAAGAAALHDRAGGRKLGEQRRLTAGQEAEIRRLICDRTPDQLKLAGKLWTRAAVAELVALRTGIRLPVRTMGLYLLRWGFDAQIPNRRAHDRIPVGMRQWLEKEYPAIVERARAEGALILWGEETELCSNDRSGRGLAAKGRTPAMVEGSKREALSAIVAVSNKRQMSWKIFRGAMTNDILIDFMGRLVRDIPRKMFLILENLKVHHSQRLKVGLARHGYEIEVFYRPGTSGRNSRTRSPG